MITFYTIFEPDYPRIMSAIFIDARASIPQIANQIGAVIKAYIDGQVALVGSNSIVYRLEADNGSLAGFFTIEVNPVNKSALLQQFVLRPAFVQFESEISGNISNFIQNNGYFPDYLF